MRISARSTLREVAFRVCTAALEQALAVARHAREELDVESIRAWSEREGKTEGFREFQARLRSST